ncbi:hypothetical protein CPter91_3809 [Collimonas pratensis]|uniref:Uncharacterized protein n=1 Tax=Collimonas pratensis TaxID=279113 RepID=A0A127Q7S6_9BURK|nr:hypothetical protein CPter91_3809 [Collimonas pratensis]
MPSCLGSSLQNEATYEMKLKIKAERKSEFGIIFNKKTISNPIY